MLPYVVKETTSLVTSRVVKGGIILSHLHGPIAITGVLTGGRQEGRGAGGGAGTPEREDRPSGRGAGSLQTQAEEGTGASPEPRERTSPADTRIFAL